MKSATFGSKLLAHVFRKEPLLCPCDTWIELLEDTDLPALEDTPKDAEIANLTVVGHRIQVKDWTQIDPVITPGETQASKVYNTNEVILPIPPNGVTWRATHIAIWTGPVTDIAAFLLYYSSLEDVIEITSDAPKSFKPGDLIITES